MPPMGDWNESREHLRKELERVSDLAKSVEEKMNTAALTTVSQLASQSERFNEKINAQTKELMGELGGIKQNIAVLMTKASMFGAIAGTITGLATALIAAWFGAKK